MKLETASVSAGVLGGLTAGMAVFSLEWFAFYVATVASAVAVYTGLYAFWCREWQLQVAVTPLMLGGLCYLAFIFGPYQPDSATDLCQLLDATGIATILIYVIWNRRKRQCRKVARP